jgi:hypothetical protein
MQLTRTLKIPEQKEQDLVNGRPLYLACPDKLSMVQFLGFKFSPCS